MAHRSETIMLDGVAPVSPARFWDLAAGPVAEIPYRRVHHPFEEHASRDPDRIAVEHLGESITYGELDRQATMLASALRQHGVQPGDHVGVFLQRSIPMVVSILATLKAGAAYVPQDLRIAPPSQLAHMIHTAGIQTILTVQSLADRVPLHDDHVVLPVDAWLERARRNGEEPEASPAAEPETVDPHATAVVIFTSGTTGRPNGVSVTHANLCNVLLNEPGALGIQSGMRVGQILNIAFDMAVWEIFGALSHGATLVIRGRDIEATVRSVDVVIATPSLLASLDASTCHNVKIVAVAGERCPLALAETWSAFAGFHNSCGPTEVTIINTLQRYKHGSGVLTIGAPLPNTTVYVLDEQLAPVPIGAVGEMWAGGACVTAGYLGNATLTAERYRPDPFLGGNARMFRTRDLGRWTETGELEHLGRTDDQVKVRGFRVELDAVTTALEATPGCCQATTILHDGALVGFVTPRTVDTLAARQAVARQLPYFYVPPTVLAVDELPRTDRGKIDKRRLDSMLDAGRFAEQIIATPETVLAGVPA